MTKQKLFLFSFVIFFCIFIPKKIFADSHNYEEIIKIIQQDLKTLEMLISLKILPLKYIKLKKRHNGPERLADIMRRRVKNG